MRLLLSALICFTLLCSGVSYASTQIFVVDESKQPIEDAILIFKGIPVKPDINSGPKIIDQIGMNFEPSLLVVQKGESVSFPNSDDIRHHVYSFSEAKSFELRLYKGESTEPLLMDSDGIVELGCNIHDDMRGFIFVSDKYLALKSDAQGLVTLESDDLQGNPLPIDIEIWHPRFKVMTNTVKAKIATNQQGHLQVKLVLPPAVKREERGFVPNFGE